MPSLLPGAQLGPHEILASIGAGGMGEVYKARDTRLNRTVAIKILPEHSADKVEARQRFEREAQAIAALNHPHICTLFDVGRQDGIDYLVMEFVEGETLAVRLERGPLPLDEALRFAIEIAGALDKAHRTGIVHRDLKPGNIMLTKTGTKLLDFGLARLRQTGSTPVFTSTSSIPTEASGLTLQGAIMGTLQYMAPEQLEGKEADARTDIFAFGEIVYEMITGRKAFDGKSQVSLIGAILEREPAPMSSLMGATPPMLDRLIKRCLAKDPDRRWQTASDLVQELQWVAEGGAATTPIAEIPAVVTHERRRSALVWMVLAGVFALTTVLGLGLVYTSRSAKPAVARFFVSAPDKTVLVTGSRSAASGIISPDGRKLAFTARDASGKIQLWIRPIDALTAQPLAGTDNAEFPFWSPDSRFIAYFAQDKLMKIDTSGGPPQTVCVASGARGGAWSREGVIVFGGVGGGPLVRVSSAGGKPVPFTKLADGHADHRFPSFLPDGRHVLFVPNLGATTALEIWIASLESGESRKLLDANSAGIVTPSGYLLFVRDSTLMAQSFYLKTLTLGNEPIPLAENVESTVYNGILAFSASDNGVLAYGIGAAGLTFTGQLAWMDRQGKVVGTFPTLGNYAGLDLSPDDQVVAVHRHDDRNPGGNNGDIWLQDSRGRNSRFTFDASQENGAPVWSPDGSRIAFASFRSGKWGIYQKASNGVAKEELLLESAVRVAPLSWTPDGQALTYNVVDTKTGNDIWLLHLSDKKSTPILNTTYNEMIPQISPDGKWLAYQSNETRQTEIYVMSFPSGAAKWQVSTTGAAFPRWSRDGKELFYQTAGKLVAVEVQAAGSSFKTSTPKELYDTGITFPHPGPYNRYAVSADGHASYLLARLPRLRKIRDPFPLPSS